ncbi:MAG: hypothetical protein FWD26_06140 [Treponema sp.]|nr:hypothetical protein [Treponema sp.]
MKKFFITLFILLVLGSVAFFFGWVQFQVPPGHYGVISSKTHGTDADIVRPGEFRWVWYKLLPTNVKIAVFRLEYTKFPINFDSTLPSGNTYAAFVGLPNVDFSWNLNGEIAFKIDPDFLVNLTSIHNLTSQQDLNAFLEKISKDIEVIILRTLNSASSSEDRIENIMSGNSDAQMEQEIFSMYPQIRDFSFIIKTAKFPDFTLYRQLRLLYDEFLVKQREFATSDFSTMAENHIKTQLRLDELERYGDLLTRYPVLLEYLQLGLNR